MLGRTTGAVLEGIDARLVEVEVDLGGGLPSIAAVGLPDSSVREGIDRIRAALPHCGFRLPQRRVIVNLAPAEVRKQGAGLDLPIAVALLRADGTIPPIRPRGTVFVGELALDGGVRPVGGALSIALGARREGRERVVVPIDNAAEAALVPGIEVVGISSLADGVAAARGEASPVEATPAQRLLDAARRDPSTLDLAHVRGQAHARRALEVAAAGGHHLLFRGPPGSGKTMLARAIPGILPPLSLDEALEVTRVWSAAGRVHGLVTERPFRAPHHGISCAGLTGGGARIRAGEITLASGGVLYLDELPEFRRDALESLRQPLESGEITIVRVHSGVTFPARFLLVASMNPCPCGFHGHPSDRCSCSPRQILRYGARVSGALRDRFDLIVDVPPVDLEWMATARPGEPSRRVRERVVSARDRQRRRFASLGTASNAAMGPLEMQRFASLDPKARALLIAAQERLALTARGFDRVRRVARTLADLEATPKIEPRHVAEALQYRGPGDPSPVR